MQWEEGGSFLTLTFERERERERGREIWKKGRGGALWGGRKVGFWRDRDRIDGSMYVLLCDGVGLLRSWRIVCLSVF